MYESLCDVISRANPASISALEVDGRRWDGVPWGSYETRSSDELTDVESVSKSGRTFDLIICDHCVHRVDDPAGLVQALGSLLGSGGTIFVSSPFLIRPDGIDLQRYSEAGLEQLLTRAGLSVSEVHSWGSRRAVIGNLRRWVPNAWWRSRHKDPALPVVVWAFATWSTIG